MFYINIPNLFTTSLNLTCLKINFIPYIYILLLFLQAQFATSQNVQLTIQSKNGVNEQALTGISFKKFHNNETAIPKEIDSIITQLNKKGYLQSELDSIYRSDSLFLAEFTIGKKIEIIRIFYNISDFNFPKKKLEQISSNITDEYFEIPFEEVSNTLEFLLRSFERQGNTFNKLQIKAKVSTTHLTQQIQIKTQSVITTL